MTRPKVEIDRVRKSFGTLDVLKDISFSVAESNVVSLIGPSGSGKSTLLRCLNLLVTPDDGTISVGDAQFSFGSDHRPPSHRDAAAFRARTGMVFQNFNLFPHLSVLENVLVGPRYVQQRPSKSMNDAAMGQLERVGLADRAHQMPGTLSGGQKQRVAIARALVMEPEVMLFDEATSALDPELVGDVLTIMRKLAAGGMTMVIVTHEIAFAREVSNHIVFMRDGYVIEEGPARDVIDRPQQELTRNFLSHFHKGIHAR